MIKKIGYYVFAAFFFLFRLCPLDQNKVFLVATHDDGPEGNIGLMVEYIREKRAGTKFVYLTKKDGIRKPFSFFFSKAYHMATASVILMDNEFMPMAYTPVSKKVKVVQLWHGTGTIKKFGLDADPPEVKKLAEKINKRITHLIVNSEKTKKQYSSAFGIPPERIYITGLPRTDLILDEGRMEDMEKAFYEAYPSLKGKRITLYAPTFRDEQAVAPELALDFNDFTLTEDDVVLLRLHPFVSDHFVLDEVSYDGRVKDFSHYPGVTTLLKVADCLITDYSSIVFEYALMNKPVLFYAYDLEKFETEGRSFYEDYVSEVPGPVCKDQKTLHEQWQKAIGKPAGQEEFLKENYRYLDGGARKRVFELIFN
ncbi:MAG: CDP-glycerol glycerophosphotransferase family protein [Eubacterium sp.]|nr:CDP-glycerol glycerophosphotransferase family protein [Eubacterium sp.]